MEPGFNQKLYYILVMSCLSKWDVLGIDIINLGRRREKRQERITSLTLSVLDEKEKDYQHINMRTRMYYLCSCYEKARK